MPEGNPIGTYIGTTLLELLYGNSPDTFRNFLHRNFLRIVLCSLLLVLSAACSPPATPTPPDPTPYPIRIQIDPGLPAVLPAVSACQAEQHSAALFTEMGIDLSSNPDLLIGYAKNLELPHQFLLGSDLLVPVVSEKFSDALPSIDDLSSIYQAAPDPASSSTQIFPVTYAQSSIFRQVFDEVLLDNQLENSSLLVAPDPESMQQMLIEAPNRVGYLPQNWLSPALVEIPLPFTLRRALRLDIVVSANAPQNPAAQQLIACLQSGAGQQILAETYIPFEK